MSFDVAIVGGGMVGATLGVALAPLNLRVAIIEAIPHNAAAQPSFDERTTALSKRQPQDSGDIGCLACFERTRNADRQDPCIRAGTIRLRAD